jgi:hypothetical protein
MELKTRTCSKCKGTGSYVDRRKMPRPPYVIERIKAARAERERIRGASKDTAKET